MLKKSPLALILSKITLAFFGLIMFLSAADVIPTPDSEFGVPRSLGGLIALVPCLAPTHHWLK